MATTITAERLVRGCAAGERRFYTGMGIAILAAVFLGFADTYYLRAWYPESAAVSPPESFFYAVHGALFSAWFVLFVAQTGLVAARRTDLHRMLGLAGVALAVAMVVTGVYGGLIAAVRPGGFVGIPLPGWQFLVVPAVDAAMFAVLIALAVAWRGDAQSHKRLMLLASICLITAAVARWPVSFGSAQLLAAFVLADLFLVPLVIRDWLTRGRLHPVTLWGGLAILVSQPLRMVLSGTSAWRGFAESLLKFVT